MEYFRAGAVPSAIPGSQLHGIEEDIACAAGSDVPVLITWPDRDRRESIARAIHAQSSRHTKAFIIVRCTGLRQPLLETDLFGDGNAPVTGSESGAIARAQGGTLLLDEVDELSLPVQAVLNQFLDTQHVPSMMTMDVRVITGSGRPLIERVLTHEFSEHLFYRLNIIHVHAAR